MQRLLERGRCILFVIRSPIAVIGGARRQSPECVAIASAIVLDQRIACVVEKFFRDLLGDYVVPPLLLFSLGLSQNISCCQLLSCIDSSHF